VVRSHQDRSKSKFAKGDDVTVSEKRRRAKALFAHARKLSQRLWQRTLREKAEPADGKEVTRAAYAELLEAVRLWPEFTEAHLSLASKARDLGRTKAARLHAERALALRPKDPRAYIRARFHFEGDEARAVIRTGLRRCAHSCELAIQVPWTYWYEGRFADCAAACRRLLRSERRFHDARSPCLEGGYRELAGALEALGDYAGAERAYRAILRLRSDPDWRMWTKQAVVLARIRAGDLAGAGDALDELGMEMKPRDRMLLRALITAVEGQAPKCTPRFLKALEKDDGSHANAFYGAIVLQGGGP
jgi:tetratricopeptide (TPR) repeat protein